MDENLELDDISSYLYPINYNILKIPHHNDNTNTGHRDKGSCQEG